MKKKYKNIIVITLVIVLLFFCFLFFSKNQLSITDLCENDRTCCLDTNLDFVCFRSDTLPVTSNVQLKDLSNRLLSGSRQFLENQKGMSFLHYRGSKLYSVTGNLGFNTGVPALNYASYGLVFNPAFALVGGSSNIMYEWRPDRIASYGTTWTPANIAYEGEVYPVSKYSFIFRFKIKCLASQCNLPDDTAYLQFIPFQSTGQTDFVSNINYNGFKHVHNKYSAISGKQLNIEFYAVINDTITQYDTSTGRLYIPLAGNEEKTLLAVFAAQDDFDMIESYIRSPDFYIEQAQQEVQDFLRMFKYPESLNDNQKQRYYQAIYNYWFSIMSTSETENGNWGSHEIIKPGSTYDGVWIWDSFFAAWGLAGACKETSTECYDMAKDWVKVFVENKDVSGKWPREVWDDKVGSGWQAPGGWSFALWNIHTKQPDNEFLCEIYPELKNYHNWIATNTDLDGDSLFMWGGSNSGWDNSARWSIASSVEALDLQGWMILDSEYLSKIASVCVQSEVSVWQNKNLQYKTAAYNKMWKNNMYWDLVQNTDLPSTKLTPAIFFMMLSGTADAAQNEYMVAELYNINTLGKHPTNNIGVNPTLARNDPDFHNEDLTSVSWSGRNWMNINIVTWLALKRAGMLEDAVYVAEDTMKILDIGQIGYESYFSTTGLKGTNNFGGWPYIWSDSAYILMANDWSPVWEEQTTPPIQCTENWTCEDWSDCINSITTRQCVDNNNCGTTNQRPVLFSSCLSCTENWQCSDWSSCLYNITIRNCTDTNNCGTNFIKPSIYTSCTVESPTPSCEGYYWFSRNMTYCLYSEFCGNDTASKKLYKSQDLCRQKAAIVLTSNSGSVEVDLLFLTEENKAETSEKYRYIKSFLTKIKNFLSKMTNYIINKIGVER